MIAGGNATIYVSNMDAAVRFYTEALGLRLTNRFGNNWATVQAGTTLVVGLHPWSAKYPRPGTKGAVQLGLFLTHGDSIEAFATRLRQHGVAVSGVIESMEANTQKKVDIRALDPTAAAGVPRARARRSAVPAESARRWQRALLR
jgi:catechol 2,3-dioxygenase-like lactoylglutathione lyase family enzyme